jgi:ADP-ribosyl-[dinitrogen reductase] hydrolase
MEYKEISIQDRCYGSYFGSIVGDALFGPVEFKSRKYCDENPVIDMNLHNFNFGVPPLPPGTWTDDTSMCLCLAKSLIENNGINQKDNMDKYSDWFRKGYMSSKDDVCIDIGKGTANSILQYERFGKVKSIFTDDIYSGNGSIMRLTPVPIFYRNKTIKCCLDACVESSETTHPAIKCKLGCKILGSIIYNILHGIKKEDLLEQMRKDIPEEEFLKLDEDIYLDIYSGSFLNKTREQIYSTGYIAHTLEAALYSFFKHNNYKEAILFAGNLGSDTDTIACVTGQISGAYYGIHSIPKEWIHNLIKPKLLWKVIDELYSYSA